MQKIYFAKVRKIRIIESFERLQNTKASKFFIEYQDDCNEAAYIPSQKIEHSLLQSEFARFCLILRRQINSVLDIGANIRISYRLTQYTLGRLMGFSISFLAEYISYDDAYRQLSRDFYVYGIR